MAYKQERNFGLVFAGFFTLVAFWPLWHLHTPNFFWLAATAVSLTFAVFFPRYLGPLSRAWMSIGHGLHWVNSRIILSFVYFIIVTPTAVMLKMLGRDLLSRRLKHTGTYWVKREDDWATKSFQDQF